MASIQEMESDLALIDDEMKVLRSQKEATIAALRSLQRQRNVIVEPLERAREAARTTPAQVIGIGG